MMRLLLDPTNLAVFTVLGAALVMVVGLLFLLKYVAKDRA